MAAMNQNQVKYLKSILEADKKYTFILRDGAPEFTGRIRLEDIYLIKQGRKIIYDVTGVEWGNTELEVNVEYIPGECEVNLVQGIRKNDPAPRHSLWCYNGQAVTRDFTPAQYNIEIRSKDGRCACADVYDTVKYYMTGTRLTKKRRGMFERTLYQLATRQTEMPKLRELVIQAVKESGI